MAKQRQKEEGGGVDKKIIRDVPDAKRSIGIAIIRVWLNELFQRLGMLRVPLSQFGLNRLRIGSGMKLQREYDVPVRLGQAGLQRDGAAAFGDGFVELADALECIAEIAMGFGEVGEKSNRLLVRGNRRIEFALFLVDVRQVVVGDGQARPQ